MRVVLFACLLAVASVSAMPQDIAPSQDRFMDMWVKDYIARVINFIIERGYDPLSWDYYWFEHSFIPGLAYVKGFTTDLNVVGLSGIRINSVHYNILLGRLDCDLVLENVKIDVGHYEAEGRYGDRGGVAKLSGSLDITGLRVVLDTLLSIAPGLPVTIHNINTAVTLDDIKSDFTAGWTCLGCETSRDVSTCVNNILNNRVPEWLVTYKNEIGTLLGEAIRRYADKWW